MDCSPPDSSVHGISQARILELVVLSSSRGSSQPEDQTHFCCFSCIAGGFFTTMPLGKPATGNWYIITVFNHRCLFTFLSPIFAHPASHTHPVTPAPSAHGAVLFPVASLELHVMPRRYSTNICSRNEEMNVLSQQRFVMPTSCHKTPSWRWKQPVPPGGNS